MNSWNPFVKTVRIPSMGELSKRLVWINGKRHKQTVSDNCDLFLSPPTHEYGTLDFHLFDEILQAGYDYAKPKIKAFTEDDEYKWIISK